MQGFQTLHPCVAATFRRAIGWVLVAHFASPRNCLHLWGPSACLPHFHVRLTPEWMSETEKNVPAKACFQFGFQVIVASDLAVKVVNSRHLPLGLSLTVYKMGIKMLFFTQSLEGSSPTRR